MELLVLGLVVISSLLGIGFGGRSEKRLVQALALIGLSCAILGAAGFVVLVYGLPVPVHPYGLALLVFILAAAAGTLLPFALIGLWLQRERHHSAGGVVFLILGFSLIGSRGASAQQQEETLLPPVPWAGFATRAPFDHEVESRLPPSFPGTSTVITSPSVEFDIEPLESTGSCDSDWDGAFIGGAIGVTPLILTALFSEDAEGSAGWLLLGVVGGIAGFWGGLAIDSAKCSEQPFNTDRLPEVACTADPHDNRSKLKELLSSPGDRAVEWRAKVGLSNADPSALTLVEDDLVCDALWKAIKTVPPADFYSHAFFELDDLYIVTDYPSAPGVTGSRFTAVLTEQFDVVNPVLAH